MTDEYRAYATDRVSDILQAGKASQKQLESIVGILTWVTFVFLPGKPRRNVIYRVISNLQSGSVTGAVALEVSLRQQLR